MVFVSLLPDDDAAAVVSDDAGAVVSLESLLHAAASKANARSATAASLIEESRLIVQYFLVVWLEREGG